MNLYSMAESENIIQWLRDKGVEPLYLMVSGSHACGLARSDSDLDIRGVYLDPTPKALSIYPGRDTIEGLGILGGSVDLQCYELKKALKMMGDHNGNIVHLFLAPTCFYDGLTLDWEKLASKFVTRRLHRYFRGYHDSQKRRVAQNRGGKSLLYSYREVMTGILLLKTGSWFFDFHELKRTFEKTFNWHSYLLDRFMERESWKVPVDPDKLSAFAIEWERLVKILDEEVQNSPLPETYDGEEELNRILLRHRLNFSPREC